jgi:hypothetical protein
MTEKKSNPPAPEPLTADGLVNALGLLLQEQYDLLKTLGERVVGLETTVEAILANTEILKDQVDVLSFEDEEDEDDGAE